MTRLAPAATASAVALTPAALHINDLAVGGAALDAGRQADDPEIAVRRMLEIGGSVLLAGPHGALLDQVDARVGRLIDALDQRTDAMARLRVVANAGAAKGVAFEDLAAPVIERAFAQHGDVVEDTSRTVGVDGRCKAGDLTVTIAATADAPPRRITFEFKDRPTLKLTGKDGALAALDQAKANRGAEVGVLVCSSAAPALEAQRLRSYPGNCLIVLLDKGNPDPLALELACQLARALATQPDGRGEKVNAHLVADSVTRLREVLDAASEIKRGAQEAARGVRRIEAAHDALRADAGEVIERLTARRS